MDKPLTDNSKEVDATQKNEPVQTAFADAKAVPVSPVSASSDPSKDLSKDPIGAYGPATTRPLITKEAFEKKGGVPWMDDPKSRLALRMFSRGVLGAAFFTAGGLLTKKWMQGYNPKVGEVIKEYNPNHSLLEQDNPLKFIAKLIDTVAGKPIEATVGAIAGKEMGQAAVHFRPTRYNNFSKEMRGRSLGDEVVNITFDFFCASVGDAWGRDIAGWFDPNVKKTWTDEKGNIKIPEAINAATKAVTKYVTYNGGEDWAVAIPYAYFMKGQRSLIDRASPGFKYDFDRAANGGSSRLSDNKIVGNYNLEGIADLQSRFTVYNIGTLMYREAYDYIGNKIAGKPDSLYGAPDQEKPKNLFGKAGDLLKWAARSAVKGVIIMTPAVPFFWITRTPQTKYKGAFIDPEKGIVANADTGIAIYANQKDLKGSLPLGYLQYNNKPREGKVGKYDHFYGTPLGTVNDFQPALAQSHPEFPKRNNFDAYGKSYGLVDNGLNAIGKANYYAANLPDVPALRADKNFGKMGEAFKKTIGVSKFEDFTRSTVYASASYTPYMYAKAEFANLWDNGKMDMAAERMIDGAARFNWGEFKAGAGEVWNAFLHKPMADPAREAEAQRRDAIDTSPADIFTKSHAQMEAEKKHGVADLHAKLEQKQELSWKERVVSAKPQEKIPEKKAGTDGASLEDTYKIASRNPAAKPGRKPEMLAQREEMRKALEELTPPTNAIN